MISVKATKPLITMDYMTGNLSVAFEISSESKAAIRHSFDRIKEKTLRLEIKEWKEKRSLDANAYFWVLCDKIAKCIRSTKEEVYKTFIRDVGVFKLISVMNDDVPTVVAMWSKHGLGWFAGTMEGSKIGGCTRLILYAGSSVYDTAQMSRLIDHAVQEAKELDIETLTPAELAAMKGEWDV